MLLVLLSTLRLLVIWTVIQLQVFMSMSTRKMVRPSGCRSMHKTVFTAKHATLRTRAKISTGSHHRVVRDPLMMECSSYLCDTLFTVMSRLNYIFTDADFICILHVIWWSIVFRQDTVMWCSAVQFCLGFSIVTFSYVSSLGCSYICFASASQVIVGKIVFVPFTWLLRKIVSVISCNVMYTTIPLLQKWCPIQAMPT